MEAASQAAPAASVYSWSIDVHRQSPFSSTKYGTFVQNLLEEPMHCKLAGDLATAPIKHN